MRNREMSKRCLHMHYSLMSFPIIFMLLFLFALTNFFIPFPLMAEADHDFTTTFPIAKITAKSDDSMIFNRLFGEVHLDNLEQTVRDLSSFHTRHTESEFLDDAASWLTEKLQSVCGQEVYVQNFTYTPDKTDDDNGNGDVNSNNRHRQEPFSYELENIVCEKPGSTNNTVMISAH